MLASALRSLESSAGLYLVYKNIPLLIDGCTLWKCSHFVLEAFL